VAVVAEPPGENCPEGGQRLDSGLDLDADGELGAAEVRQTTFVCQPAAAPAAGGCAVSPAATPGAWPVPLLLALALTLAAAGRRRRSGHG
jgi:MYXO-CTERM domain-containing protein